MRTPKLWWAVRKQTLRSTLMFYPQEADCYFGPVFNGTFDEGSIKDENFNIEYGDGEFLTGVLGYENVTVAGLTVDHQEVALVNYSYWFGDSVTSGLMGLAYPLLTSAFEGTNTSADSLSTQVEYDPIITTMIKENIIDPVFSLALDRNSDSGYLALGGLPPVNYTGSFATTPILMVSSSSHHLVRVVGTRDLTVSLDRDLRRTQDGNSIQLLHYYRRCIHLQGIGEANPGQY